MQIRPTVWPRGPRLTALARLVDHGATREEILETLGMAYIGAGPSAMAASHALDAYAEFAAARANAA
jgi:alkylhydroperoxidase/carboxymuconolactone decarboxylase family protein YurZ